MTRIRQAGKRMQTSLRGIANKARADRRHRFRNLYGLLNEEALLSSWPLLNKQAAGGVDRVSAQQYAEDLEGNVGRLVERLKRKSYRARLVRRRNIPKEGGRTRPLGIPVVEDKLLQITAARILEAIWEQDFQSSSYGSRPGRGPQLAVGDLTQELQFGCYGYVVEIDIRGFYDHVDHGWLLRMLEERIDDRPFLRLIRKWLKAGVLEEDGEVIHPQTGTPQGGCISPILANIYLHYVLDLWFARRIKPRCQLRAYMCRYLDDVVFAFQRRAEAEAFYRALPARLAEFGLELAVEKSRVIRFSRFHLGGKAQSFEFLGFEFRWIPDRAGTPRVTRRTARKRFRASLARFTDWIRAERHRPVSWIFAMLNRKLVGYYNYYGVRGNYRSIETFLHHVLRILFKWLNRRSQRKSYTWQGFGTLVDHFGVAPPRLTESRNRQLLLGGAR
jgi:RNA-directed DNA polymerase